ncbi:MAG: ATP synthase F1 subunit delta [Candidatus Omnitrophica bacterium]|nr:ATP synthase F1 subunit delta [Candidatus Omnitrophota bacterium]
MRSQIIVKRYALAYIDFAQPTLGIERCVEEMKDIKRLLREEPDFDIFLKAPEVSRVVKARVLQNMFKAYYSEEMVIFINYLISKNRVTLLPEIANQVRLQFAHSDLVDVVLRTTFPLELDTVSRIKLKLEQRLKQKANLYLELDPDLLGGVQVIVGNTVIDGSVRNRLAELKKKLLQSQVI